MHELPIAVSAAAKAMTRRPQGWRLIPLEEGVRDAAAYVVSRQEADRWMGRLGAGPILFAEDYEDPGSVAAEEAAAYEASLLPPFSARLLARSGESPDYFATPGHHGGAFFQKTLQGRIFMKALGEGFFQADLSDSDDVVGDPSSHEGPGGEAERLAASAYHADRTYFVLNGTSASNRICCAAVLAPGDLVLFDRNHHKSLYQGALEQCGAVPVYLETARNAEGIVGGLPALPGKRTLRRLAEKAAPGRGRKKRPFRLACVQLCTYDGIFVNAQQIIRRLGSLCDYILFDAAWAGYELWIPFMKEESPLTLRLTKRDPGILVTQSVHKQLAGFSQTSQIQRKDSHVPAKRRVLEAVFQSAYLSHISTSPSMPLLAGLEMNAAIHREMGEALWEEARRFAIALRRRVLAECRLIRPFQPDKIGERPWSTYSDEELLHKRMLWELRPGEAWHGFHHLGKGQALLDPCKVLLLTGDRNSPIAGAILARYLSERRIVAEKSGFHTLLLLAEPGDDREKLDRLMEALRRFEEDYESGTPLTQALPALAAENPDRYGKMTLPGLCRALEACMMENKALRRLGKVFGKGNMPRRAMSGREAKAAFVRGEREWKPLEELPGRIALESAAAYPPGICTIAAGEVWNQAGARYYRCMTDISEAFPGLSPELHGIHKGEKGRAGAWVLREGKRKEKRR